MRHLIEKGFALWLKTVYKEPPARSSVQYQEVRKAFICGFQEAYATVVQGSHQLPEEQAMALLSEIADELKLLQSELTQHKS